MISVRLISSSISGGHGLGPHLESQNDKVFDSELLTMVQERGKPPEWLQQAAI